MFPVNTQNFPLCAFAPLREIILPFAPSRLCVKNITILCAIIITLTACEGFETTTSGLQYKLIEKGKGPKPKMENI